MDQKHSSGIAQFALRLELDALRKLNCVRQRNRRGHSFQVQSEQLDTLGQTLMHCYKIPIGYAEDTRRSNQGPRRAIEPSSGGGGRDFNSKCLG